MTSVNAKYLKDENGETFSPIVSTSSIYDITGSQYDSWENGNLVIAQTDYLGDYGGSAAKFYRWSKVSNVVQINIRLQLLQDWTSQSEPVIYLPYCYLDYKYDSDSDSYVHALRRN